MPAHRFQKIEHGILQMVLQSTDTSGYSTGLSALETAFRSTITDITSRELVDTLKRLRPRYLTLWKWLPGEAYAFEYPDQIGDDDEFFYRNGGFWLRRTPETDPHVQELEALLEQGRSGHDSKAMQNSSPKRPGDPIPESLDEVIRDIDHWMGQLHPDHTSPGSERAGAIQLRLQRLDHQKHKLLEKPEIPAAPKERSFIAESRIEELRKLSSPDFDFQKLVRLCEELNSSYGNGNLFASAMLTRGILDHVPPLLGHQTFLQVANNYGGGGRSFREHMQHLEGSARKVSDGHLHMPIRKSESLPEPQQVWCGQELDALLGEIVRIMK